MLDPVSARREIIRVLKAHAAKSTGLSDPPITQMQIDDPPALYVMKAAYLKESALAGMRMSGFPLNSRDMPRTQMMLLCELGSARALALVAIDSLTGYRVGGTLALTIENLRSSSAKTMALIGAGTLALGTVRAVQATTPFQSIRVAAKTQQSAERFCRYAVVEGIAGLSAASTVQRACEGADVIVTLSEANEPLIKTAWCGPGTLLVSAGGHQECEDRAILDADKIFIDDWRQCSLLGDVAVLHRAGKLCLADIDGTLADIVAGKIVGRATDEERIVAVPQGLTIMDLALCELAYRDAAKKGIGQTVSWI